MFLFWLTMIDQSWLNPDVAQQQLALLAVILLACLILLPLIFGGLLYFVLSLIARLRDAHRVHRVEEEKVDEAV